MNLYEKYPNIPFEIIDKIVEHCTQSFGAVPVSISPYASMQSQFPVLAEGFYVLFGRITKIVYPATSVNIQLYDMDSVNVPKFTQTLTGFGNTIFVDTPVFTNQLTGIGFADCYFDGYLIQF